MIHSADSICGIKAGISSLCRIKPVSLSLILREKFKYSLLMILLCRKSCTIFVNQMMLASKTPLLHWWPRPLFCCCTIKYWHKPSSSLGVNKFWYKAICFSLISWLYHTGMLSRFDHISLKSDDAIHWSVHPQEEQAHTSVARSPTNDDKAMHSFLKCTALD